MKLTDRSQELFIAFAKDAGNWSGTPLVGGNVQLTAEDRGNLTQIKKAGLVVTFVEDGDTWLDFTPAGKAFAAKHGITI